MSDTAQEITELVDRLERDLYEWRSIAQRRADKLAAIKEALADPVAVHMNMLRGTIAMLPDAEIKHLYPHLFENQPDSKPRL